MIFPLPLKGAIMVITLEQAQAGLAQFIDTELVPHLSGMKKIGLAAYSALAARNIASIVRQYQNHPAVAVMNIFDADGNLDIEKLYNALDPLFAEKQKIEVPMIGEFIFDHSDLEKLYRYMKG